MSIVYRWWTWDHRTGYLSIAPTFVLLRKEPAVIPSIPYRRAEVWIMCIYGILPSFLLMEAFFSWAIAFCGPVFYLVQFHWTPLKSKESDDESALLLEISSFHSLVACCLIITVYMLDHSEYWTYSITKIVAYIFSYFIFFQKSYAISDLAVWLG